MARWIRRIARWLVVAIGFALALAGVAMMVLYLRPDLQAGSSTVVKLSSFIPYGVLAWVVVALILVLSLIHI